MSLVEWRTEKDLVKQVLERSPENGGDNGNGSSEKLIYGLLEGLSRDGRRKFTNNFFSTRVNQNGTVG